MIFSGDIDSTWASTDLCIPALGGSITSTSGFVAVVAESFSRISPQIKRQLLISFSLQFLQASRTALRLISMPVTDRTRFARKIGIVPVPL